MSEPLFIIYFIIFIAVIALAVYFFERSVKSNIIRSLIVCGLLFITINISAKIARSVALANTQSGLDRAAHKAIQYSITLTKDRPEKVEKILMQLDKAISSIADKDENEKALMELSDLIFDHESSMSVK